MSRSGPIRAAGAVVFTGKGPKRSVAVVHRPAYDDWSLPKGKAKKSETSYAAAVREVEEETGARIRLGAPLTRVAYEVKKGAKVVDFWVGHILRTTHRTPDDEVDRVEWLPVAEAAERLTYPDERAVLAEAVALPSTVPFVITRHTKAVPRKDWKGEDRKRPIDSLGRKQAKNLVPLYRAYDITHLTSSSSTRCLETLAPYANVADLKVKAVSLLSEEVGEDHRDGVERYVRRLAQRAGRQQTPTALCGHRPVLPSMLAGVDVLDVHMAAGTSLVAHVRDDGVVVAHEWHPPVPREDD